MKNKSNRQNVIYVLLTVCRKSQFIIKIRTSDYNLLIENGRHE